MAKFVTFTNETPPYEGQKIVINVDNIVSVYKDLTAGNKVALWSTENFWHVRESFEEVCGKLGLEITETLDKKEIQ